MPRVSCCRPEQANGYTRCQMAYRKVLIVAVVMTLAGCLSEQEHRRQAEAAYQSNCHEELEHLARTVADRWDRRIAQNDVIVRCMPEKAVLANALTAYARAAQQAVRGAKVLDEDAWAAFQNYTRALGRHYELAELQVEAMRIQAAAQELTGLDSRGGLSRRSTTPAAAHQSTSAPRFSP
jgi:hypothetical protein